jgi:hypothetical protein
MCVFEAGSHYVAQTDLQQLVILLPHFLSAEITDMHLHTWLHFLISKMRNHTKTLVVFISEDSYIILKDCKPLLLCVYLMG